MKKLVFIFFLTAFGITSMQAQTKKDVPENNPNAPKIEFEKTTHDYGTVEMGGDGTCKFEFTNNGKEPLILSRPRSSCGCTVPTWPKKPILPGKSDEISVTYNTKKVGVINKSVTIYSNASNNPIILRIKGKVVKAPAQNMPEKTIDKSGSPVNR
jgi:uncharacterized protein DUF1573